MQTEFVSDIIVFLYQTWAKLGKKAMSLSLTSPWVYSLSPLCWAVLATLQTRGIPALTSLVFGPKHSKNVLKKYKWEVFSLEGSVWGRPQLLPSRGVGAGDAAQRASSDGQGDWTASSPGSSAPRTALSPAPSARAPGQPTGGRTDGPGGSSGNSSLHFGRNCPKQLTSKGKMIVFQRNRFKPDVLAGL